MPPETLKTILLVEDDVGIREVASTTLRRIGGYAVSTCNNGKDAVELARRERPDLILMDVMMPIMDGVTAFETLLGSEKTAGIPVIFLTAKAQPNEVRRYRELGALEVIVKPFDAVQLPRMIENIWTEHE